MHLIPPANSLWDMTASYPTFFLTVRLSLSFWLLLCFHVFRGMRSNTIDHLTPLSPFFLTSFSIRVINAGKSMLNEDQASCEKLFVKKPSGKHRNSTMLEDNGVSKGQSPKHEERNVCCAPINT